MPTPEIEYPKIYFIIALFVIQLDIFFAVRLQIFWILTLTKQEKSSRCKFVFEISFSFLASANLHFLFNLPIASFIIPSIHSFDFFFLVGFIYYQVPFYQTVHLGFPLLIFEPDPSSDKFYLHS